MDIWTCDEPRPDLPRRLLGKDVNHIRAAFNLYRDEFAQALGVSTRTVIRWEKLGPSQIPARGFAARLLLALRDRIVVEGVRLEEARTAGRFIAQSLLRHGRLAAVQEMVRFAAAPTHRRPIRTSEDE